MARNTMGRAALAVAIATHLSIASAGAAQPAPDSAATRFDTGGGVAVLLTEFGLGAGALYRVGVGSATSLLVEASLGAGRDEREQQFFVGLFGETVTPFKRNYVLMAPVHVGLERRLFQEAIEDDFRPFVQLTAGPTVAYQWPYFDDANGDGLRDEGEERLGPWRGLGRGDVRMGAGGTIAVGAYFGRGRASQGLRFGYAGSYFFEPVELLEEDPEVEGPTRRFFGTPVVSFHLLRMVGRRSSR
jgi:hypothetical protein